MISYPLCEVDEPNVDTIHVLMILSSENTLLKDVLKEVSEVNNWFLLGVFLDVPVPRLQQIELEYSKISRRLPEVIIAWMELKAEEATWTTLVKALLSMGENRLATGIARKHGRFYTAVITLHFQSSKLDLYTS